jgi:hypothetical protein
MPKVVQQKYCYLLLLLAGGDGLLLAYFSSWFSSWACPSPPRLAADYLSFSSWAWS